jgi:hypothetical protein
MDFPTIVTSLQNSLGEFLTRKNNKSLGLGCTKKKMKTIQHSWYNYNAHIFRIRGQVLRQCKIEELTLENNYVACRISFIEDKRRKSKLISPITLASIQCHWLNKDIVSESESDDIHDRKLLPLLRLTGEAPVTLHNNKILKWVTEQTDMFVVLST